MLEELTGRNLGSVTFMPGHMSVAFDGGTAITIFEWPLLVVQGETLREGAPRYAEVFRTLVGHEVLTTTVTEDYFDIGFDNGVLLQVRLDTDGVGGEYAIISRGTIITVLRAGGM
jgi:hypothetical protein